MNFTQDDAIWAMIKNAYTNNEHPIIFIIFNLLLFITIIIAIYSAYKWIKDNNDYKIITISASILTLVFLISIFVFVMSSENKVGKYKGTVDIAFTSPIKDSNNSVAVFSKNNSSNGNNNINSFVMNTNDMKKLEITSGKTVTVSTENKPAISNNEKFIALNTSDIKDVKDSNKVTQYNQSQEEKEKK
uniref:hypothetical protein n=1 Tax=Mycobacterium marinum TaxID=1781 RepID=UPI0035658875